MAGTCHHSSCASYLAAFLANRAWMTLSGRWLLNAMADDNITYRNRPRRMKVANAVAGTVDRSAPSLRPCSSYAPPNGAWVPLSVAKNRYYSYPSRFDTGSPNSCRRYASPPCVLWPSPSRLVFIVRDHPALSVNTSRCDCLILAHLSLFHTRHDFSHRFSTSPSLYREQAEVVPRSAAGCAPQDLRLLRRGTVLSH